MQESNDELMRAITSDFHLVPYSELAMLLKLSGRHITYAHVKDGMATISVDGDVNYYCGLISELLPIELRKV